MAMDAARKACCDAAGLIAEFCLVEGQGSAKAKVSAKRMSTTTPTIRR
jgi:hypothetical protein